MMKMRRSMHVHGKAAVGMVEKWSWTKELEEKARQEARESGMAMQRLETLLEAILDLDIIRIIVDKYEEF